MILKFDGWPRKTIDTTSSFVLYFKAIRINNWWIQTGIIVRKCPCWGKNILTSVTLTFDLWPWCFAWTSLLSIIITPKNFMMIRWQEHCEQGIHSSNNNPPQPLDRWTNSRFMGQQVGNCRSFTLTHYLANLFAMHCGPRASPIVCPTLYPTHISFIPSQSTFPFLKFGYQRFDLKNPRSSSCMRSKFKVTNWVQHPIDSYPNPFGSMSIHPLIPMIELF